MAKPNTVQAGRDFVADLLSRAGITPGTNPAIDALLQNEQALAFAGEGALGRSELSRQYDDLRNKTTALADREAEVNDIAEQQRTWWETHKDDATLAEQVRTGQVTPPTGRTPVVPPNMVTREEAAEVAKTAVAEALKGFGNDVIGFGTQLTTISHKHFQEFGNVLDTAALVKFADERKIPLPLAHDAMVAEARKTKQDADVAARIEAARKEGEQSGRDAVMSTLGQQTPYPVGPVTPGAVLTGLEATRTANAGKPADQRVHSSQNPDYGLNAALQTFHEETAKNAAR